ncbi:MAG: hypothetical protein ACTSP3_11140 [Candidatus Heimdallarchaeaceae archaeon]
MEEVEVVKKTFDFLTEEANFRLWIDNHPAYSKLNPKDYPRHSITIKGFTPDLLGFSKLDDVIAIEAKGTKDIQKGIGQALTYKEGSHLTYLAAEAKSLSKFQLALKQGNIGSIFVTEKEVRKIDPVETFRAHFIDDTKRELLILNKGMISSQKRITSLTRNQIVNYLAPLLFVSSEWKKRREIEIQLENYNIQDLKELIRGAKIIGLIKEEAGDVRITDEGFVLKKIMQLEGLDNLERLKDIKKEMNGKNGKSLAEVYPELSITLKMIYSKNELFIELLEVFEKQKKKEMTFRELVEEIVKNKPNLFVNLFCPKDKKEAVLRLYQNNEEHRIYEEKTTLRKLIYHTTFFTFKKHLIHLGILSAKSMLKHSGKKESYEPDEDLWILN